MFIRAYLRASTKEQDANRARKALEKFADSKGFRIAVFYTENHSGASLFRPELFRLLSDCSDGDILLVEQIDRLSRLNCGDWDKLKNEIKSRNIKIVSLDLPTSWDLMAFTDETTSRIMNSMNEMMLDTLAAVARKDYVDKKRRQAEGIAKAKNLGRYKGRPEDESRNKIIADLLNRGLSWNEVCRLTGASRSTLSRVRNKYLVNSV